MSSRPGGTQAGGLATKLMDRNPGDGPVDARGMGFPAGSDAVVPIGFVRYSGCSAGICWSSVLSRRMETTQGRELEHGHARRPGLDDRICLQLVGVVQRLWRAFV